MSPPETTRDDLTKYVCYACIGDPFLSNEVKEEEVQATCSYCEEWREAMTLEHFVDRTHEMFQCHFKLTPSEPDGFEYTRIQAGLSFWYREGSPVRDIVGEVAEVCDEIADEVAELLSIWYGGYQVIKDGGEDPYDTEAQYEEREPDDWSFRDTWTAFREEIETHTRFFSPNAEDMLHEIFGDLTTLKARDGRPIIREIGPNDEDRFVWRARTAQSNEALRAILQSPILAMGAPPSSLAKSGRMNAQGVSVFYGAMDESTCVAEVRPPVGSHVATAKFELLRCVRLLDLDAMANVDVEGSYFDPTYAEHKTRMSFLRHLVGQMSRPVMPQDETSEYLATQVVAEYLANKQDPRFDGIIFHSSQTSGGGRNVVLFNHVCHVEPYDLPADAKVTIHCDPLDESGTRDEDGEISIFEAIPANATDDERIVETVPKYGATRIFGREPHSRIEPTIRMDVDSLHVLHIDGVQYNHTYRPVNRLRYTKATH